MGRRGCLIAVSALDTLVYLGLRRKIRVLMSAVRTHNKLIGAIASHLGI